MWRNINIFGEHFLEEPLTPSTKSCCCYLPSTAFPAIPYLALSSWVAWSIFVFQSLFHMCACSLLLSQKSWLTAGGARSSHSAPQLYRMNSKTSAPSCWEPSETATTNLTSEERCGDIIIHTDWGRESSCSHRWDLGAKWLFLLAVTFFGGRAKETRIALLWVPPIARGTL